MRDTLVGVLLDEVGEAYEGTDCMEGEGEGGLVVFASLRCNNAFFYTALTSMDKNDIC